MKFDKNEWTLVGHIGVDAGLCWIGDPCYILHKNPAELPESLGEDWSGFCEELGEEYPTAKSFNYTKGYEGLGVVVSTGLGDGFYPVYAKIENLDRLGKSVTAIYVDFLGDQEDDDEL